MYRRLGIALFYWKYLIKDTGMIALSQVDDILVFSTQFLCGHCIEGNIL